MTAERHQPIYFLAFDHRGAFARAIFDSVGDDLSAEQERTVSAMKGLIYEAAVEAAGLLKGDGCRVGILIDEQYGAEIVRAAGGDGIAVAMPVERADREVFEFMYGDRYREHIAEFEPDFAKVLVRYNVDGDAADNAVQRERLADLSGWLRERETSFLFELVVPPTAEQLRRAGGDRRRFELAQRPELAQRAVAALQEAGVDPQVWKIEGIDAAADAAGFVRQMRSGGRDDVVCTVLGADADPETVDRWLRTAAVVEGFEGFAIGRSIWSEPVREHLQGAIAREDAVERIARRYLRFVDVSRGSSAELV